MALADTIEDLLARQRVRSAAVADRGDLIAAWQRDIDDVLDHIGATIRPFVESGAARVASEMVEISEDPIGVYRAQQLLLTIADRRIVVAPVARITFGGTGRIDMYRDDRPSERDRFFIVRDAGAADIASPPWLMENKDEVPPDPLLSQRSIRRSSRRFYPLSTPAIESAIDYLLKMA